MFNPRPWGFNNPQSPQSSALKHNPHKVLSSKPGRQPLEIFVDFRFDHVFVIRENRRRVYKPNKRSLERVCEYAVHLYNTQGWQCSPTSSGWLMYAPLPQEDV